MMSSFKIVQRTFVAAGILILLTPGCGSSSIDLSESNCRRSLGMQSGAIPDYALKASSSYDPISVGPTNARIRTESSGGAWCPKSQISKNVIEWIEVDLQELKVITRVETQGRFGNGQGQEFAEYYSLNYQRIQSGPWVRYHDRMTNDVFVGNSNTYIAEVREINPPIIARKIRVIPRSSHPRTVCMRIELYGCQWRDGLLSYSMPQGEQKVEGVDLYDFTYDGIIKGGYISGGLGQLTDGMEGHSNFHIDPENSGRKGFEWVGWRNDTISRPSIEMLFEFDRLRNFSSVRFHCNNMFSKDVRVFRRATVYFSARNGTVFHGPPIAYVHSRDNLIEFARNVIVPLDNRVGKYVRAEIFFDSKWMMVSEVRFESDPVTENYTEYFSAAVETIEIKGRGVEDDFRSLILESLSTTDTLLDYDLRNTTELQYNSTIVEISPVGPFDERLAGAIIGITCCSILLLLSMIAFFIVCRIRHWRCARSSSGKILSSHQVKLRLRGSLASSNFSDNSSRKLSDKNTYSNIATCDTEMAMSDSLNARSFFITNGGTLMRGHETLHSTRLPELTCLPFLTREMNQPGFSALGLIPRGLIASDITSYRFIREMSSFVPANCEKFYETRTLSHLLPFSVRDSSIVQKYATSDINVFAQKSGIDSSQNDMKEWEILQERLIFIEKLSEGCFGELYLCEMNMNQGECSNDFRFSTVFVTAKFVKRTTDRSEFYREAHVLVHLRDPNIIRLIGICTKTEPYFLIYEFLPHGDLCQFLKSCLPLESSNNSDQQNRNLSYGCLIYMATQIASGMKFLEGFGVAHRDLASRNCMVGNHHTVKIGDFAMTCSLYNADYYQVGNTFLPIRWMAYESILMGIYSSKSDVWSFAVTLWEILTLAHERPLNSLTDEQVMENCSLLYYGNQQRTILSQPSNCPKEIYDLMVECWNLDESLRPSFSEIHMFLHHKNMGFQPTN